MADATETKTGWLATLPTTNTRILVTLAVFIATAAVYLWRGVPAGVATGWDSWLIFVAVMAGIDASQYIGKRFSDWTYAAAKNGPAPTVNVTAPAAATGVAVTGDASIAPGETSARFVDIPGPARLSGLSGLEIAHMARATPAAALEIPAMGAGDVDALTVAHTRGGDVEHSDR